MSTQPILRISPADLDALIATLEVRFVALTECVVSAGYRLEMPGLDAPGIHYNLAGNGRLVIEGHTPIDLRPHTLIIVPPGRPFRIEVASTGAERTPLKVVDGRLPRGAKGGIRRVVAGTSDPGIILICGFFRASHGALKDIFADLSAPIVEQFARNDQLDSRLKQAMHELVSQEIGSGAMSTTLLKQVLIALLRRSLSSMNQWVEHFAILRDPPIARAFADMVARPETAHSVSSLARKAFLSRSTFMARFVAAIGRPPMAVLRDLRMRQAAEQLAVSEFSVEQIARRLGYANRGSFVRAFRNVHGRAPRAFREAQARRKASSARPRRQRQDSRK